MRTQVLIIGGGPSGLLLSQLLSLSEIDCIVLEKHTKEHVLSRVRYFYQQKIIVLGLILKNSLINL